MSLFMVRPVLKEYRKVCLPSMYFERPNFKKLFSLKKLAVITNLCFINITIKRASSPVWCVQYIYTLAFCIILSVLYISLCCFIKCENKWIEMNWTADHEFKSTCWLLTISTELIFFFENQNFPPI